MSYRSPGWYHDPQLKGSLFMFGFEQDTGTSIAVELG
jgi:hypothetical protein